MNFRSTFGRKPAALALFFASSLAFGTFASQPLAAQDWEARQVKTAKGYKIGNPQAETQLIEYVSYSCPHCATYVQQSHEPLDAEFIRTGKAAVEIRHVIRNRIDLSAALLTQCGATSKFFGNHNAMMLAQDEWLAIVSQSTPAQQANWSSGSIGEQMRTIADDLGFYAILQPRGYNRAQLDQCLNDESNARNIANLSGVNSDEFNVPGTPSFVVNGNLLDGVHSWRALEPRLNALMP